LQSCDKNYSLRFLLQHCKFSPKKFSIPTLDFRKALPRSCSHGTPLPCGQSAPQTNKSPWRGNLLDAEPSKSHVGHASRMPSKQPHREGTLPETKPPCRASREKGARASRPCMALASKPHRCETPRSHVGHASFARGVLSVTPPGPLAIIKLLDRFRQ
jgi:hypothetical protein